MKRWRWSGAGIFLGAGLSLGAALPGCASRLAIRESAISFSAARQAMTREYIAQHYGLTVAHIEIVPRIIVLHWTAIDDVQKSFDTFATELLAAARPELAGAGQVNVSVQFLVARDGAIHRLMPENWMARHCIGLNYNAIGIENAGGENGIDNLTPAQIQANIALVRYLAKKYPTVQYLIGHYEYLEFEHHPLWLERDPGYRTVKSDPGARFMSAVRAGVAALALKGPAEIRAEKEGSAGSRHGVFDAERYVTSQESDDPHLSRLQRHHAH